MLRENLDETIQCFKHELALRKEERDDTDPGEETNRLTIWIDRYKEVVDALEILKAGSGDGTYIEFNIRPLAVDIKYGKHVDEHGNITDLHIVHRMIMDQFVRSAMKAIQHEVHVVINDEHESCLYLNEYTYDRAYGGPEEGGWYYDTYSFIKCHGVVPGTTYALLEENPEVSSCSNYTPEFNKLMQRRRELQKEIDVDRNDPRGSRADPGSVMSEGRYVVQIDEHPGEDYPKRRPHYE